LLLCMHACTNSSVFFFFFFCIAKISMIHRKDLAEFGYKATYKSGILFKTSFNVFG
jgi:hypothetical protein